jgi:hypothetical protein
MAPQELGIVSRQSDPTADDLIIDKVETVASPEGHPLVLIEWEDSAQPIAGWSFLDSFDALDVVRCQTVGWLIHDGDAVKAIAQNVGNLGDDGSAQVSGVIRIPARCIVSMRGLDVTSRASPLSGLG